MKNQMHSKEDMLRKAEELITENIHEAANRYFSGNMSAAESQAFDSVLVQNPDMKDEVQLQSYALRSARVAGRVSVREKLAQASARARHREQIRSRQRVLRTLARVATPVLAACLILAVLFGWGNPSPSPRAEHFADVNSFGVLYAPQSAGGVKQATLFRVVGEDFGFLMVPGSFRIKWVGMEQQAGLPVSYADLIRSFSDSDADLNSVQKDNSLRWALCEEMRSLGLPVRDPIRLQNQRWEEEANFQLAEMDKSGFSMHYAPLTGFLAEEDPDLYVSTLTLPSQRPISMGQGAESAGEDSSDLQDRFWKSPPFKI